MIWCGNPHAQYRSCKADIDAAIARVLEQGRYILGKEVDAFEKEFAQYIGVSHAIGVGSGTEAIHLALAACEIGPDDEVITVSHTAVATVAAIELTGATPVLVDIEPDFYAMDPSRIEKAITSKTRAILPVHLYGQAADLKEILSIARRHHLKVIEDCSQAHGATCGKQRIGSLGDLSCFSFYPTKNLGAIGDGGAVLTNNAELEKRCRLLREYGWAQRYVSALKGWNTRLDEIQAAVLRVKLQHLDASNAKRAHLAALYDEGLHTKELSLPKRRTDSVHAFHLYVVRSRRRNDLQNRLRKSNIDALVHYPVPIHLQPAYQGKIRCAGLLTETERSANEVLSLPLYPELDPADVRKVIEAVNQS